jgi:hypothetical protein
MMGPTTCYVMNEEKMELAAAASYCAGLAPNAVVAKVPTMDDLMFLVGKIDDDTPYLIGATCPGTVKVFGSPPPYPPPPPPRPLIAFSSKQPARSFGSGLHLTSSRGLLQ